MAKSSRLEPLGLGGWTNSKVVVSCTVPTTRVASDRYSKQEEVESVNLASMQTRGVNSQKPASSSYYQVVGSRGLRDGAPRVCYTNAVPLLINWHGELVCIIIMTVRMRAVLDRY